MPVAPAGNAIQADFPGCDPEHQDSEATTPHRGMSTTPARPILAEKREKAHPHARD